MKRLKRLRPSPEQVRKALKLAGHDSMAAAARATQTDRSTLYRMLREGVRQTTATGTVEALRAAGLLDLCL